MIWSVLAFILLAVVASMVEDVIDNKQTSEFIQAGYEQHVDQETKKVIWVKVHE